VTKGASIASCCTLDSDVPHIIQEEILAAITQIEDHLINECGIILSEGTFYFKFDKKDNLYLTFVAGLRAASKEGQEGQEPGLAMVNSSGRHPILRCVEKAEPRTYSQAYSSTSFPLL
jgi:hypothetical protein